MEYEVWNAWKLFRKVGKYPSHHRHVCSVFTLYCVKDPWWWHRIQHGCRYRPDETRTANLLQERKDHSGTIEKFWWWETLVPWSQIHYVRDEGLRLHAATTFPQHAFGDEIEAKTARSRSCVWIDRATSRLACHYFGIGIRIQATTTCRIRITGAMQDSKRCTRSWTERRMRCFRILWRDTISRRSTHWTRNQRAATSSRKEKMTS